MMMENFHPPLLSLNTNTNEAQTQLTIQLQEMLDKCVPEKIIKETKKSTKPLQPSAIM